ncbi:Uncharacterised protein [Mycobacteroides abscessus subsp. abscessus]|nr:Uncharacterised protein [Mycobacteroides abscessus subsp. abscessus]
MRHSVSGEPTGYRGGMIGKHWRRRITVQRRVAQLSVQGQRVLQMCDLLPQAL